MDCVGKDQQVASAQTVEVAEAGQPLLEVDQLEVTLNSPHGVVHAVQGVSLELPAGRTLGIVGESGSGKSILAKSIMNIVPHAALREMRGAVRYQGRDLGQLSGRELRRIWGNEIAIVFQNPLSALHPLKRIGVQITESLKYHLHFSSGQAREHALELLRSVGISDPARRIDQYPHQLSGGMRQRVCIAIALSANPRLLIADEPTTALDITVQAQILDLIAREQERRGMAVILISHDLAVVAGRSDEVAVMYAGQVVEHGPTGAVFAEPRMPYTAALRSAAPVLADPPHTRLNAIAGTPPNLTSVPAGCHFAPRCPYAQSQCHERVPELAHVSGAHRDYRCWYPLGNPVGTGANHEAGG